MIEGILKKRETNSNNIYIIIIIVIGISLQGCKHNTQKEVKTKHKNGKLFIEQEFKKTANDSLIGDGYYKEYHSNGNLSVQITYDNGLKNGETKAFYENGNKKYVTYYRNDLPDSIEHRYYKTGELSGLYYRYKGQVFGIQKVYNKKGQLEELFFNASKDSASFIARFNNGNLTSLEGRPLYLISKKSTYAVNETFYMLNYIVKIDGYETILDVKLFDKNLKCVIDTTKNTFDFGNNNFYYLFNTTLSNTGKYTYQAIVRIVDSINKEIIKQDTIETDFFVK